MIWVTWSPSHKTWILIIYHCKYSTKQLNFELLITIFFPASIMYITNHRIHFVEEFVNARPFRESSSSVTDILRVKVMNLYKLYWKMIWIWIFTNHLVPSASCYNVLAASGHLRCSFGNGGCWKEIRNNSFYSACFVSLTIACSSRFVQDLQKLWISTLIFQEDKTKGCECPSGFNGDGVKSCEGILSCKIRFFFNK